MKLRKLFLVAPLLAIAALMGPRRACADVPVFDADFFNNSSIGFSTTSARYMGDVDELSLHAIYSSATLNALSLTDGRKSTGTITVVSTSSLTTARLAINGCVLGQGDAWTSVSTTSGTASAISAAINATPCLTGVVVSTWASSVVYTTASVIGTAGNAITLFTNTSSITVSGATLSNGTASSFGVTTDKVTTTAAHGMTTGLPLLFVTVTGTVPTGLTTATTYYAIVTDAVNLKLASSSANALAGTAIDITAITGSGTFTLTPTAFGGSPSFKWQASNDNATWADLAVTSVTFSTPWTATSTLWDFTSMDYKYLRLNFTGPSGGGLNLRIAAFGKRRHP